MYINGRPPETDSEDDYEGFSFGDEDFKKRQQRRPIFVVDVNEELYHAVMTGDLHKLKKDLQKLPRFVINDPIKGGLTILHNACRQGYLHIVQYLINERADVNYQIDSITPLMEACCYNQRNENDDDMTAARVVELLISKGAIINVSDKYGVTPMMFACKNGLSSIVKILLKNNASLDARDNFSNTALFYAVENNHPKCVKLLIGANMNLESINRNGLTARQIAQFNDYKAVLEQFPAEMYKYSVPSNFLSYNIIQQEIPKIFLKTKNDYAKSKENNVEEKSIQPEYFPDIHDILLKTKMEMFLGNFALNQMNLHQFLTMNDKRLSDIEIEYPIHRKKILLGLIRHHLEHWSNTTVARVKGIEEESFYDMLLILGNHLKNVVIINSAIAFVQDNLKKKVFGKLSKDVVRSLKLSIFVYKNELYKLEKTCKYLNSFASDKPPLYINYDSYMKQKKCKKCIRQYFKYSILIGLPIVICLKIMK